MGGWYRSAEARTNEADGRTTSAEPGAERRIRSGWGGGARVVASPHRGGAKTLPCPFCQIDQERVVASNELAVAIRDGYPVNPGHTLVIPRRHLDSWFDASRQEQAAMLELVEVIKAGLDQGEPRPDGFNIGINVGEAAGQTVMHLHVHLIPRFAGDVDDPRGGVRWVVPERGNYLAPGGSRG